VGRGQGSGVRGQGSGIRDQGSGVRGQGSERSHCILQWESTGAPAARRTVGWGSWYPRSPSVRDIWVCDVPASERLRMDVADRGSGRSGGRVHLGVLGDSADGGGGVDAGGEDEEGGAGGASY
jgi:hypothetical protein